MSVDKTDKTWRKVAVLAIAPLAVIIVVVCLAYLSQIKFRERMVFQTQQQLLTIARTTARSVNEFIAAHSEALQTVARDTLLQEEKGGKILRFLRRAEYSPLEAFYDIHKKDIDAICLLNHAGTILFRYPSVRGIEEKRGVSLADRPDVAYVLREHKPSISRTFHNSSGSLVVSILEPVFYRDRFKGIIQRIISTDTLSRRFIEPVKLRGRGCVWMFDDNNVILSYPQREFVWSSVLDVIINMHLERGETFDEDRLRRHILEDHSYLNKVKVEDDGYGMFVDCNHNDELVAYKKVA
ncbi:MAG: cache domain-containing protein, partial [Deltaproteobacteria bacterium]|nr:cache domain-containing protein [Deltaproteobacteria bacterium]